ncbi:MAG: response regulator [Oscillospiraceae bacterium]|jgi:signal transduction histidine kinase/CheY-like chemotaxis protein/HPt (histidine-containing phosphotransfer) domain-containing protein|nr:response regulator [Oscillospiraceae bacterium]
MLAKFIKFAGLTLGAAFIFSMVSAYFVQTASADREINANLEFMLSEVERIVSDNQSSLAEIRAETDKEYIEKTRAVAEMIRLSPDIAMDFDELCRIRDLIEVDEIHIIDENGILVCGTTPHTWNLDFATNAQTLPFLAGLDDPGFELAQDPQPNSADGIVIQYIGVSRYDKKGLVQIGMRPERLQAALDKASHEKMLDALALGSGSRVLIIDPESRAVLGDSLKRLTGASAADGELGFIGVGGGSARLEGTKMTWVARNIAGELVVGLLSSGSMYTARNIALVTIAATTLIIYAALFFVIALLVRLQIIRPIGEIQGALEEIGKGNFDASAKTYNIKELGDLSGGINGMKENIRQMLAREQESNKSKTKFLATMSHEIRTPMNTIIGVAQIELRKHGIPEEYASALEMIYSSGSTLLGIVNDVLDMSKIETGGLEINPAEYDLPSLISDAVQLNVVRIGSKPIEFILHADKDLPSRMIGDELRIKQILNNLLSNAIKYTKSGCVTLTASHFIGHDGGVFLCFSVADTGQGIKQADLERLFTAYARFNTAANRAAEGTGLGLTITKRLVEMMDGEISAESEWGKGSVFSVTLRQRAVDCAPIGAEVAENLRGFRYTGARRQARQEILYVPMPYGRVLIVDDVDTNLYVAEGLMMPYQLKVETANSGFAALEKVQSGNTYDVIFMDHMMPDMDGIETTEKLRAGGYKGAVVALTANALAGNDEMFASHGFDGFIPKPIDTRSLNAALHKFVRDRKAESALGIVPDSVKGSAFGVSDPTPQNLPGLEQKLRTAVCRDAEKALPTLRKAAEGDIKLYTIAAHGMKSALLNVGEHAASAMAKELETAGKNGDLEYIAANTAPFIQALEGIMEKLRRSGAESRGT